MSRRTPADQRLLDRCAEEGQRSGLAGHRLEACPYRRADRRGAWVRGWHEGAALRARQEHPITDAQREAGRDHCAALMALLTGADQ